MKSFTKIVTNEKGLSLVGMLVGAAASMAIGLAVAELLKSQGETVSYLEDRLSATNLRSELQLALDNRNVCLNSLNSGRLIGQISSSAQSSRPVRILNHVGNRVLFQAGSKYENLDIKSITATTLDRIPASGTGDVEFSVAPVRHRGKMVKDMKELTVKRRVTLDASSRAVECTGLGLGDDGGGDGSEIKCLKNMHRVAPLSETSNPNGITVPENSKSLVISIPSRTESARIGGWGGGGGSNGNGDGAEYGEITVPAYEVAIVFGQTQVDGKVLEAGKKLTKTDEGYYYDGVFIGSPPKLVARHMQPPAVVSRTPAAINLTSQGATCPSAGSVTGDRSGNGVSGIQIWR